MSLLSTIVGIRNIVNGIGNMFKSPETEEEKKANEERLKQASENRIQENPISTGINNITNFIPNLITSGITDIATGGKTKFTENTLNKTPVINKITGNTPNQEEQYKDTSNEMLLDFFKTQEETRKQELQEAYAREDAIRKETQEREDNAYQRAVEDMQKAGINPNLVGISPSASGGGITSASRTEQILGGEISSYTQILNALIEKDTTIEEGEKNRILGLIQSAGQIFAFSKFAKK